MERWKIEHQRMQQVLRSARERNDVEMEIKVMDRLRTLRGIA